MSFSPLSRVGTFLLATCPWAFATPESKIPAEDMSSIRTAYENARHSVHKSGSGNLTARNPGQRWNAEFDGKGFTVAPDHGNWTWGLELRGYAGRTFSSSSQTTLESEGNTITVQRDEILTEWFINDKRGVEQGWTLGKRPEGLADSSPLKLHLSTRGDLRPEISTDGLVVSFSRDSGATALSYGGLKAWDADNKPITVRFESAGDKDFFISVDETSARYPITIDPVAQQAYLKAHNPEADDGFGSSVAISGDTIVIGAPREDGSGTGSNSQNDNNAPSAGAAYVFVKTENGWEQQAYLKASNTEAGDTFGSFVGISGNTIVVGAPEEKGTATGVNGDQTNNQGSLIGAAYVFVRNGTTWSQQAYLKASQSQGVALFGRPVAVSGDTIVIGAPGESNDAKGVNQEPSGITLPGSGAAYIFRRSDEVWIQEAYLKASNARASSYFGLSVAVHEDRVIVGCPHDPTLYATGDDRRNPPSYFNSGSAYIFARSQQGIWTQEAFLKAPGTRMYSYFGSGVGISGNTVVVTSSGDSVGGSSSGAANTFVRSGVTWSHEATIKSSPIVSGSNMGHNVSFDGDRFAISYGDSGSSTGVDGPKSSTGAIGSGGTLIFERNDGQWAEIAFLKGSNTEEKDYFGSLIGISGNTVVCTASGEDSASPGVNGNQENNSAKQSGAAYVFDLDAPVTPPDISVKLSGRPISNGDDISTGAAALQATKEIFISIRNTGTSSLVLSGDPLVGISGDAAFSITSQPPRSWMGPDNTFVFTVRYAPQQPGTHEATITIASNDVDQPVISFNLSGEAKTSRNLFASAASEAGLTGGNASPGSSPFGDDVKNLIKYAFNMDLSKSDSQRLVAGEGSTGLPVATTTGPLDKTFSIEYVRRKASGLIYTPKQSSTLAPQSFVPMTGTTVIQSIDENWERVTVTQPIYTSVPVRFGIVEVSLPE